MNTVKTIELQEDTRSNVVGTLSGERETGARVPPVHTLVSKTTSAEYLLRGDGALVIHLFPHAALWHQLMLLVGMEKAGTAPEQVAHGLSCIETFWRQTVAAKLNEVAPALFKRQPPELVAHYTDEMNSWGLILLGAADRYVAVGLIAKMFIDDMDAALNDTFNDLLSTLQEITSTPAS